MTKCRVCHVYSLILYACHRSLGRMKISNNNNNNNNYYYYYYYYFFLLLLLLTDWPRNWKTSVKKGSRRSWCPSLTGMRRKLDSATNGDWGHVALTFTTYSIPFFYTRTHTPARNISRSLSIAPTKWKKIKWFSYEMNSWLPQHTKQNMHNRRNKIHSSHYAYQQEV